MFGSGIKLGRIFGINVRVDWSWLLIFLLITWNLAAVFGQMQPGWTTAMRWGIGLLASLLFFLSVLAHEMAHSLVARAQGLPVRSITLFLFGGVSNIQREPDNPKQEFWMTIVGPVTSILLGLVMLLIVGQSLGVSPQSFTTPAQLMANLSPVNTILLWLGSVNIILGLFNLIPGFPLDGGRILRSIFWAATNSLTTATRWAALIGQLVAWTFIVAGIAMAFGFEIPFFGSGLLSGMWLAFIGWFLSSAAQQSYQQVAIKDLLEGVPVTQLMRGDPPTVAPEISVADLVFGYVMGTDDQSFPVMQNDHMVGLVTLDDVRKVAREDWGSVIVGQIMTPKERLVTAGYRDDAADSLEKLLQQDVRQLPVLNNRGELLGLLRRTDIMRYLQLVSSPERGRKPVGAEMQSARYQRPENRKDVIEKAREMPPVTSAGRARGETAGEPTGTGGFVPATGKDHPQHDRFRDRFDEDLEDLTTNGEDDLPQEDTRQ